MSHRAGLGEAVPLEETAADAPDTRRFERGVERRGAGHHAAQARQVVAVHGRMLGEGQDQWRNHERPCDAVALQGAEERLQLELGHRHQGRAAAQCQVEDHLHPVDMEKWQHRHDAIRLRQRVRRVRLEQVGDEIAVREHDALGEPRSAARVRQHRQVRGGIDRHVGHGRVVLEQGGERRGAGRAADHEHLLDSQLLRHGPGPVHERGHGDEESSTRIA